MIEAIHHGKRLSVVKSNTNGFCVRTRLVTGTSLLPERNPTSWRETRVRSLPDAIDKMIRDVDDIVSQLECETSMTCR